MKWITGLIVAVVAATRAAVVIIPMVVDPNDLKPEIFAVVTSATAPRSFHWIQSQPNCAKARSPGISASMRVKRNRELKSIIR
jgi:hypothetical protein